MAEWIKKKLGDLGYSFSGLSGKTIDDFGEGKPFIPYMNIFSNGKIDPNRLEYVKIEEQEHQNKVEQGDWFFTTSSETPEEVGMTSVLVDDIGEAYLNSFCFGFRLYDKKEFNAEFISYLFRSEDLRKKISLFAQGSTRYNLPKQQMFEKLYISYPKDINEQKRIAKILSSADKVISTSEALIEKYKAIKKGMLNDLLKPKEGWKKVKLGDCGDVISGGTPSTSNENYWNGDVLFVTPLDLGRKNIINNTIRKITEQGVTNSSATKIKANSLAVSTRAPIGLMSLVKKEYTTNQGCKSIQFYNSQEPLFHYYNLMFNVNKIQIMGQGTTFMEISKTDFENLEFFIPDSSEQGRIASILQSIDNKIEAEQKVVNKYKGIKLGLMNDLLTKK